LATNTQYSILNTQYLKNKRVLITAGPTWVPIDSVRVISNVATGKTGILLAEKLKNLGAKVTLLLGPVETNGLSKNIRLMRFKFFDELKNILIEELRSRKYDIIVHSAAVSDYRPLKIYPEKIKSGLKKLNLELGSTEKIVDLFKRIDSSIFLVGFKFEPSASKDKLIAQARGLMIRAGLDLVVANRLGPYRAFVLDRRENITFANSKSELTRILVKLLTHN